MGDRTDRIFDKQVQNNFSTYYDNSITADKESCFWRGMACLRDHSMDEAYSFVKALDDASSTFFEQVGIYAGTIFFFKALLFGNISN